MKEAIGIIILAVIFMGIGTYMQSKENRTFNGWINLCSQDGGMVTLTGMGINSQSYECMKDGKIIDHID